MRKNKMMRFASGLLVATLLTTSIISGTFAKYVTEATGNDSARVAKFGVEVTANGETFAKEYAKTDSSFTLEANTVASTEEVVAPGTSGNMAAMTLKGTPEVAVRVTYKGAFKLNDKWTVDGTYYCPLEVTVNNTTYKGNDYANAAAFEKVVNDAIDAYSNDYKAGTDLSTIKNDSLNVSWAWAYEGNDDAKDTKLGKAAADNTADAGTVTLNVKTTVTQID